MNLTALRTKVWEFLRETSTNTSFSSSTVTGILNQRLNRICRLKPWPFLRKESVVSIPVTTVSAVSTGLTLNATAVTGLDNLRYITVTDGDHFERVQIASIAGLVATLVSPGLTESYAAGSYIIPDNLFLPYDIWHLETVREWHTPAPLIIMRLQPFDRAYPQVQSMAERPDSLHVFGTCRDRYPSETTTLTADATTSTTSVVDAALTALTTDYYKDWRLVNTTIADSARITAYNATSKALTLARPIAAQAVGNTYYLLPDMEQFFVNPLPTSTTALRFRYLQNPPELVNGWDEPILPEAYHDLLVYAAMIDLAAADRDNPRATTTVQLFSSLYATLYAQMLDDFSIHHSMGSPPSMDTPDTGYGDGGWSL